MKKILFLLLSFTLAGITSCSSDDDKADVNYVTAKFNGVEIKFNIISVDKIDYDVYSDIIVTATTNSDPTKKITISSEYGVTGQNEIWRFDYETTDGYYVQDFNNFTSTLTTNSAGKYIGTFSGSLVDDSNGNVMVLTNGAFNIAY
jgi:hypothetical protein